MEDDDFEATWTPNTPPPEIPSAGRVVIGGNDLFVREGLAVVLHRAGYDVVAQTPFADELIEVVDRLSPDLLIVDVPPATADSGFDGVRLVRDKLPGTRILALTTEVDTDLAEDLLGEDGVGYRLGQSVRDAADFIESVELVLDGRSIFCPGVTRRLIGKHGCPADDPLAWLSGRERDVLAIMAQGRSNEGIARKLFISEGTVEKHLNSLYAKLHLEKHRGDHRRVLAVLAFLHSGREGLEDDRYNW